METGLNGLNEVVISGAEDPALANTAAFRDAVTAALAVSSPERLLVIAQALRAGFSTEEIQKPTGYDPWFIEQIRTIVDAENGVRKNGLPASREALIGLKQLGFSDIRLAELVGY